MKHRPKHARPARLRKKAQQAPRSLGSAEDQAALDDLRAPPEEPTSEDEARGLLSPEAHAAKRHWALNLRPVYEGLLARNHLNRSLYVAQQLTSKAVGLLRLRGVPANEALRLVAKMWLFPAGSEARRLNRDLAESLDESDVLARVNELSAPSDLAES